MKQTIEDFKKEISGNDIYLIGGGTSFDPEKYIPLLPKSKTICINFLTVHVLIKIIIS